MRIIERKAENLEARVTCIYCKSILGVTKGDVKWYMDMSQTMTPYIHCPVCGKYMDVEGNEEIRKIL